MPETRPRRRRWPWIAAGVGVLVLVPGAIVGLPILLHSDQGQSGQYPFDVPWPIEASASGDDGRNRVLNVMGDDGSVVDTSALFVGQRLAVTGGGYDGSQGIYVAICVIPPDPATKPGPCVGGVPEQTPTEVAEGTVQYAVSNWINDDWAWKLFGARSYDSLEDGAFTAYLEVGEPAGNGFDCRVDECGIFTRNDHTALNDRVQDLYVPVGYSD